MTKIIEIMPDDMPNWMQEAIDEGQLITKVMEVLADAHADKQELVDKLKRIRREIGLLETQDTSPDEDKGFESCQRQALNCFEDWSEDKGEL